MINRYYLFLLDEAKFQASIRTLKTVKD